MRSSIRLATLLATLLATFSCCPCKHLATSTTDSTRVEVRDRVVKVRDTVVVELPAERVEVITPDTTSTVQTSIATSTATVSGGVLTHSIENKQENIRKPTEVRVEVRDSIIYRDRQTTEIVEVERELTWWQRFRLDAFWAMLAVGGVAVALKLKNLKII